MIYRIVKYGDPVLETSAEPVTEFDTAELREVVDSMFETMYAAKGVGLAAPQIGLSQRIAVIDTHIGDEPGSKLVVINPEIVETFGSQTGEEGCLSIPGFRDQVTRPQKISFRGQDVSGKSFEMDAEDLLARAVLHETDHLNGVMFLSHLSPLKRDLIRRRIRKLMKAGEWE